MPPDIDNSLQGFRSNILREATRLKQGLAQLNFILRNPNPDIATLRSLEHSVNNIRSRLSGTSNSLIQNTGSFALRLTDKRSSADNFRIIPLRLTSDILLELDAFVRVYPIQVTKTRIIIKLPDIVIDGVPLGDYYFTLSMPEEATRPNLPGYSACNYTIFRDPKLPALWGNRDHPHIYDRPCWGHASAPLTAAISRGDLFAIHDVCRAYLTTYNEDSPYIPLYLLGLPDVANAVRAGTIPHRGNRYYQQNGIPFVIPSFTKKLRIVGENGRSEPRLQCSRDDKWVCIARDCWDIFPPPRYTPAILRALSTNVAIIDSPGLIPHLQALYPGRYVPAYVNFTNRPLTVTTFLPRPHMGSIPSNIIMTMRSMRHVHGSLNSLEPIMSLGPSDRRLVQLPRRSRRSRYTTTDNPS